MAFVEDWAEEDFGSRDAATIDDLIESLTTGVRERMAVEHHAYADETGHSDVWRHKKASARSNYGVAANKPTTEATGRVDGAAYYETDTGLTKYWDAVEEEWVTQSGNAHAGLTSTYATGLVSVTVDSAVITGTDTVWSTNITTADVFKGPDGEYYGIQSVDADGQITLDRTYVGTTAAGQAYTIYLDGHPQYVRKSGGTIDGDLAVTGTLAIAGALALVGAKITGLADGEDADDAAAFGQLGVTGFKVGTYTGDGADDHEITGLGFDPHLVLVYGQMAGRYARMRTSVDTKTKDLTDGSYNSNEITALTVTAEGEHGFTLGSSSYCNSNGATFTYIAIKGQ